MTLSGSIEADHKFIKLLFDVTCSHSKNGELPENTTIFVNNC